MKAIILTAIALTFTVSASAQDALDYLKNQGEVQCQRIDTAFGEDRFAEKVSEYGLEKLVQRRLINRSIDIFFAEYQTSIVQITGDVFEVLTTNTGYTGPDKIYRLKSLDNDLVQVNRTTLLLNQESDTFYSLVSVGGCNPYGCSSLHHIYSCQ